MEAVILDQILTWKVCLVREKSGKSQGILCDLTAGNPEVPDGFFNFKWWETVTFFPGLSGDPVEGVF